MSDHLLGIDCQHCGECARFAPHFFPYGVGTCLIHRFALHPCVLPERVACERFSPIGQRYTSDLVVRMDEPENEHRKRAWDLRQKYGLGSWYSIDQIQLIWEAFSESLACGWAADAPERIERVFGVRLKELEP